MVQAWYMDDSLEDPRLEHHLNPPEYIPVEKLFPLARVEYWKIDVENLEKEETFAELRKSRGYDYDDLIDLLPEKMPDYDAKLKTFYTEHLHDDEEIRLFLEGSGYFDVRDKNDKWIRINAAKGDLLVLPAGCYHRFSPDKENYAKVMRLFCGAPVWQAFNRPAEDHLARKQYLNNMANSA